MKAAILSELSAVKNILLQQFAVYLVIGLVIGVGMGSTVAMVSCISAMAPILMVFTFAGYDATNGWERFRATLPVSRDALVVSRYVNVLASSLVTCLAAIVVALALCNLAPMLPVDEASLATFAEERSNPLMMLGGGIAGMCFILMFSSVLQPFILRFGLTKALRWVPAVVFLLFIAAMLVLPDIIDLPGAFDGVLTWLDDSRNLPVAVSGLAAATLGVYCISCGGAIALYRTKEL